MFLEIIKPLRSHNYSGTCIHLYMFLFNQRELLIGTSVTVSLPASGFNSNMIGLEYFRLAILF